MHARVRNESDPARNDPFLRQLPQRLTRLRQRGERCNQAGWDINAVRILADDAALMAGACRRIDAASLTRLLDQLGIAASGLLDPPRLPDRAAAMQLATLIDQLAREPLPRACGAFDESAGVIVPGALRDNGFPLLVMPPERCWRRIAAAAPAVAVAAPSHPPASDPRSSERHVIAQAEATNAPRPALRETLLQRVSECGGTGDARTRSGGLLLLVAEDNATQDIATDTALADEIGRYLDAQMAGDACMAADAPGQFLLFDPDRNAHLLEAWALSLRARIARIPFSPGGTPRHVLFDIGVCPFSAIAGDAPAMRSAARHAIDEARATGRSGVSVVRSGQAPPDHALVERIRFALDATGLEVLFQPIVSLQGDADAQFQALLRLRADEHVLHTAAELVPAATQAGLIEAIDRWVLLHCLGRLGRHADRTRQPRLFLSQSLASMRDAQAPKRLRETLAEHRVAPSAIVLELHCADVARAPAEANRYSAAMQALGTGLALSGFDDMRDAHLLDALRPRFVKLEPHLPHADAAPVREPLRARIDALHERGVRVIAPRVEDARGAAALCSAGVDFIQGNFVQAAESELAFDFQESVM